MFILPGGNVNDAQRNGPAKISVKENGPLVASLLVESDAPGCNKLLREIRLVSGLDRVEIIDTIDKKAVRSVEGVHIGFGFNVPNAALRINIPWGVIQPEKDQLAGACKNWFSVERWVDISNDKLGVTWSTRRSSAPRSRRPDCEPSAFAAESKGVPVQDRGVADDLFVGDEQPLAHELSRRSGRRNGLSLRDSSARDLRSNRRRAFRSRSHRAAHRGARRRSRASRLARRDFLRPDHDHIAHAERRRHGVAVAALQHRRVRGASIAEMERR